MIYYSRNLREFTQNILGLASHEYDLIAQSMSFGLIEGEKIIGKWAERYNLYDTAQKTYKRRLNAEPVFALNVHFITEVNEFESEEAKWQAYEKKQSMFPASVQLHLFCRTNDVFLRDGEDSVLDKKDRKQLQIINRRISDFISNAEDFKYLPKVKLTHGKYEFVQLTKPKKSIKELKANNWKAEQHASLWTWRLTEEALKEQMEQNRRVILRFQNLIEKKSSLEDKRNYFDRHFQALEGYLGHRGVRQQIGLMYHDERRLFKNKYGKSWAEHGARPLNLTYLKKYANSIPNNTEFVEARNMHMNSFLEKIEKDYQAWKAKNTNE